ncbi:MAG: CU044_5270 family protein [Microbispora sp.]|nr:CU044_5270 family protein [Microbispora sp.]
MVSTGDPAAHVPTVAMLSYHQAKGESPMPGRLPPARSLLLKLAEAAERQPDVARPANARYGYLQLNEWRLNVAVSGGQVGTAVVPTVTELWVPISATGRVRRVERPGTPIVIGYGSEQTAGAAAGRTPYSDEELPPGAVLTSRPPEELPLDAAALRQALLAGRAPGGVPEVDRLVQAVISLYSERIVPPRLSAALWRMLAGQPQLGVLGDTTDRAGRPGRAIALDMAKGLPKRLVLIIDPETGRLNSSEEILTKEAGKLNVEVPAVIGYQLFLHQGWTPDNKTVVR